MSLIGNSMNEGSGKESEIGKLKMENAGIDSRILGMEGKSKLILIT